MTVVALSGISRRRATPEDVAFLLELRRQTISGHQVASGVSPSDEERQRRVAHRYDCAEIILQDGNPVGLLKLVFEIFAGSCRRSRA